MLPFTVATEQEIPAGAEEHYVEKDGKFYLDVPGVVPAAQVSTVQRALAAERAAHKETKAAFSFLDGQDVNEVKQILVEYPELKKGTNGNVDQLVQAQLNSKITPLQRQLETTAKELESERRLRMQLEAAKAKETIVSEIRETAVKVGVRPDAIPDIVMYAGNFEIVEGQIVTKDGVGISAGLDVKSWLSDMRQSRALWWPENIGGGAGGSGKAGFNGKNPWSKETENYTEQAEIIKNNPQLAERLKAQAKR